MSAKTICEVTDSNRYIGFPYTKFMNSMISVNQAAAVVLTSVANANDHYYPSERVNLLQLPRY